MSLPRFLHPGPLAANTIIDLPEALAHHAVRVLRLKPDAAIVLFDGRGGQYPARLIIDGKRASAELGATIPSKQSSQATSPWCKASPPATKWTGSSKRR